MLNSFKTILLTLLALTFCLTTAYAYPKKTMHKATQTKCSRCQASYKSCMKRRCRHVTKRHKKSCTHTCIKAHKQCHGKYCK